MNKRLREFIFVTSLSFTLVTLINAMFGIFDLTTIIEPIDTLYVFLTCFIISILIVVGDLIPFIKDHLFIYNYLVVLIVALGLNTLILGHFYWDNFIVQVIMLTFVFFGVGFGAYGLHCKQAMMINKKISEKRKRNQI